MKLNQIFGFSTFIILAAVFARMDLCAMDPAAAAAAPPLSPESEEIVRTLLEQKRRESVEGAQENFDSLRGRKLWEFRDELRLWELAKKEKDKKDWTSKDHDFWGDVVEDSSRLLNVYQAYRANRGKYRLELTREEVIAAQQQELQEWEERYWQKAAEVYEEGRYPQFEAKIEQYKQEFPRYEVAGGASYTMSLDELEVFVKAKFQKMRQNGQILTRDDFQKLNPDKWYWKGNEVTRIWGADYLAIFSSLRNANVRVPRYIIVADDLSNIRIKIVMKDCFPMIANIQNGQIYAQNIKGNPVVPSQVLKDYGFTDYGGSNSVVTPEGVEYVVDTEYKSFYDGAPEYHLYGTRYPYKFLCEYLKNRFKLINRISEDTITIEFGLSEPR